MCKVYFKINLFKNIQLLALRLRLRGGNCVNKKIMEKKIIILAAILTLYSLSINGQNKEYNEEEVRKLLDKYIENPKLYYDKIKALNERADKANENTMKVSEEYLSLLDKKDSLIKIYKNKATMASRMAPAQSVTPTSATQTLSTGSPAKPSQQTTTIVTKVQGKSEHAPYRVQLAAYFREDFEKFFGNFNKTLGIQKLNNRNVIEVQGFKDETEAMEFSQKIQKLGFPGAFVTKYDENGERQEGYKTDNKFYAADPPKANNSGASAKVEKTIQYPDYIPLGYKEHMKKNMESVAVKAAATPTSQTTNPSNATAIIPGASSSEPINLRAPNPQRDAIISSTNSTGTQAPQIQKPRTIASTAPVPNSNENPPRSSSTKSSNTTPPSVNKNTRDQLDVAFDQLFKR